MKKRHTEEQIIGILKEQEAGMPTVEVCRRHGISPAASSKWKSKFGGQADRQVGWCRRPVCRRAPRCIAYHTPLCGLDRARGWGRANLTVPAALPQLQRSGPPA